MVETRRDLRHRVLKAGSISFSGGAIDCTVRNLSTTGAALKVASQERRSVGWAKARLRRAHHLNRDRHLRMVGTLRFAHPTIPDTKKGRAMRGPDSTSTLRVI